VKSRAKELRSKIGHSGLNFVMHLYYNVHMKSSVVQIRIEPELEVLIKEAAKRTGLSKSEVMRQGLRKGLPLVVRALGSQPRRTLVDALRELKGLEIPERRHPMKRRV
jgi:hypothetical protein